MKAIINILKIKIDDLLEEISYEKQRLDDIKALRKLGSEQLKIMLKELESIEPTSWIHAQKLFYEKNELKEILCQK